MSSSAPYTCQKPWPKAISDDPDITGYGVVAGYMATAGIAICLILVYFLVIYDPALDPFSKQGDQTSNPWFRSNPVDKIFLQTVRYVPKGFMRSLNVSYSKVEQIITKCLLAMSDAQLITGLSILISGFVQLPQGLPSYHWMAIIDLAWFSSLTHLACLTILRGYLHHHSVERMLRVIAMACLATLLVIALSFTSSYSWANVAVLQGVTLSYEEATPTHAAICHMGVADFQMHLFGYLPMIFSIIMIVFGFLSRLIKLYKTVSVGFLHKTRVWLGIRARHLLCIVFNWCCTGAGQGLKRRLLYRPLLTVYLAARLLVDAWLSMLLEVAWLLAGFVWGSLRLMSLLLVVRQVMVDSSMIADTDNENKSWGFGQVVSIALLLAPFITFAGFFNDGTFSPSFIHIMRPNLGRKAENSHDNSFPLEDQSSDLMEVPLMSPCNANTKDPEDPENDWNDHWELLGAAVTYLTTMSLALAVCTFAFSSSDTIVVGLIGVRIPLVIALLSFFELMLFSLTIEVDFTGLSSRGRKALHLVNIFLFAASPFPIFVLQVTNPSYIPSESGYSWFGNYWFMILAACFYVLYTIPRSLSDHAHIGHSLRPRV